MGSREQLRLSDGAVHRSRGEGESGGRELLNSRPSYVSRGVVSGDALQLSHRLEYLQLYAHSHIVSDGDNESRCPTVHQVGDADVQLAELVSSLPHPVSLRGVEQWSRLSQCAKDESRSRASPAVSAEAAAAITSVAVLADSSNDAGALTVTGFNRFELTSAEGGDLVERDVLAGHRYWAAKSPNRTYYAVPSALLEAKERREGVLFRRYSQEYEKLVRSTANRVGGEAGDSLWTSFMAFKAECTTADQKPIHKRSFYQGPSVDWRKILREQATEMISLSCIDRSGDEPMRREGGGVRGQGEERKMDVTKGR
ncbi:hypothetical protein CUR178_05200 [Leishmania enriettii]|uniref:Uncharacterized protein n=1 Tax=Leishmania enriettii TaxID=5663 RepID=A0A836GLT5_LEIEN|nr:hypothetical protein CUR178_05200 [Leishmania enriettii]